MGDLTKNFNRSEFACKGKNCCGNSAPISTALVQHLQTLRDYIGQPLTINSGFRCNRHNANVGEAKASQHVYGTAADVATPKGMTSAEFAEIAENLGLFDGIGLYDTFVKQDVEGLQRRK